ncbi:MAG: glycosyltransferase [Treponema sp.]|nr:glycosyltransferase [Treponema sp.]
MADGTPELTIITINRNDCAGLERTLRSVMEERSLEPGELEYIVIDGASTDGSVQLVEEYASRKGFRHGISYWVSEPDGGIYAAMNKGLARATGKLVGIINSGDTLLPYALAGLSDIHRDHPGAVLYGAFSVMKEGVFDWVQGFTASELPNKMIPHNASFVPLDLYRKYGPYSEYFKICADYDLFLKMYVDGVPFVWLNRIVCDYALGGLSDRAEQLRLSESEAIRRKYGCYVEPSRMQKAKRAVRRLLKKIFFFLF